MIVNVAVAEPVAPEGVRLITSPSLTPLTGRSVVLTVLANAVPAEPPVMESASEASALPPLIATATAEVPVTAADCTAFTLTILPDFGTVM
jgi:hypothetical protein